MEEDLGAQYRALGRLREEPPPPPAEADVQRLWFEQAFCDPLVTDEGERITILQPGYWNHGGGPDFLHAALRNGNGETEHGAVEIHLRPGDWAQHGHAADPHYDPVILHAVWEAGPKAFFPRTSRQGRVRQVVLSTQLRAPLAELRGLLASTPEERDVGARIGRCRAEFDRLDDAAAAALLREAGWHRFHQRVVRMRAREALVGFDEALWQGLADALGYAANRGPFGWLARRVPVKRAAALKDPAEREALLYGLSGLLPARRLDGSPGWPRAVWDVWWKQRAAEGEPVLPKGRWSLRGQRPANRPERRLAVLVAVAGDWKTFSRAVAAGDAPALARILGGAAHPYWSRRFSWKAVAQAKPSALIGPSRLQAFLYNTAWPLAWTRQPDRVRAALTRARAPLETHPGKVAAFRLLGSRKLGGAAASLLVREGLIQVYQDFCVHDGQCMKCAFSEVVRRFGGT